MSEPAAPDLSARTIDAEIFSVGVWNDETFTAQDLREIARNFQRLRKQLKPPLKFGHDDGQTLLGQRDGDPALGWVERLWVRGDKLVARFAGMPQVVYEAIRDGRYRRVSAELYFDVRQGGRRLGKALKAVALLGADLPAVTNLQDLTAYLAGAAFPALPGIAAETVRAYAVPVQAGRFHLSHTEQATMTDGDHDSGDQALGLAGLQAEPQAEPRSGLEAEWQTELAELRAYKAQQEHRQGESQRRRQTEAFRSARESALAFSAEQVRAGRLPPHLHEGLSRELNAQARHFAEGQPLRVSFDWVQRLLATVPSVLPQGETAYAAPAEDLDAGYAAGFGPGTGMGYSASSGESDSGSPGAGNPSAVVARLAANAMTELNLSYGEAAAYVLRTRPNLARAYRDYTLNPTLNPTP